MAEDRFKFMPAWNGDDARLGPKLIGLALRFSNLNRENLGSGLTLTAEDFFDEFSQDLRRTIGSADSIRLEAAGSILVDLVNQGRKVEIEHGEIFICGIDGNSLTVEDQKKWIREQELTKRNEQLGIPSVLRFIEQMESSKLRGEQFVSIFSLMRNGRDLADKLQGLRDSGSLDSEFQCIVQPYLQIIDSDKDQCEFTGLALGDIWRYFRHTWTNQATSVPGRSMRFLVRDKAAPSHPVIGIGAIGSPVIGLSPRDKEIGWDSEGFLETCRSLSSSRLFSWVNQLVEDEFDGLYLRDLKDSGILDDDDIESPDDEIIERVRLIGDEAKERHRRHSVQSESKRSVATDEECESRARTDLYKWKRCDRVAVLLKIKKFLGELDGLPEEEAKSRLLKSKDGKWVISTSARLRKASVIGINVADIIVCGAVAPYNAILGGKLISALSVSPQVVSAYNQKYSNQISEIASGMAGRKVIREPNLVLFGTTSLYGSSSSQYNRIKIPCNVIEIGSRNHIEYKKVGVTQSYGSSQFSERTITAFRKLVRESQDGIPVNYLFGEGVSPKLRNIRTAFQELGLPPDSILKHAKKRAIYMIPVASNYSEFLMGLQEDPEYFLSKEQPEIASANIAKWWMERWAIRRCGRDEVLADVRRHDFTYPIEHGARVQTPEPVSYQDSLFE